MVGSSLQSQKRLDSELFESLETRIQDVIRAKTESRRLFPVEEDLDIDIDTIYFDKLVESVGVSYAYSILDVPEVDFELTREKENIPVMASAMAFPYDEWRQLSKAKLSRNERILKWASGWAINEDIKAIIGDADVGQTNIMDQTNNSTDVSGTKSVTTIANIHATISGIFDQLDDNLEFNTSNANIKVVVTRDVKKKMRAVLNSSTDTLQNGWAYAQQIISEFGGPGSELMDSKYLNGSATFAAGRKKPTVTDGVQAIAGYPFDPEVLKIKASPMAKDEDEVTVKAGKYIRWAERWSWKGRRQVGIITGSSVTIA